MAEPGSFVPSYPYRELPPRGHPPQRLVEVRVGGAHGYAYCEAAEHERILASAKSAIGYRRAVLRAAVFFNARPLGGPEEAQA
jgi:hypothetical protein